MAFVDSYHISGSSTPHDVIGADNVVIDGNTFVDTAGINLMGWADADADGLVFSNNVLTCGSCSHVRFQDGTSFNPLIESNTFNGGDYGVNTDDVERVSIEGNTFNNQADFAIRAFGGDFDAEGNTINNPGEYAIYADTLSKPVENPIKVVAGVNTDYPVLASTFIEWDGSECNRPGPPCVSPDVYATNAPGQEMVMRVHDFGTFSWEIQVLVTDPDGITITWDPANEDDGDNSADDAGIVLTKPGIHAFSLKDTWGDGPNGAGFEVVQSVIGAFSPPVNNNPIEYWDPGVDGLQSTLPGDSAGYSRTYSAGGANGCSKDMDGVLIQNTGTDPRIYELTALSTSGNGFGDLVFAYFMVLHKPRCDAGLRCPNWNMDSNNNTLSIFQ